MGYEVYIKDGSIEVKKEHLDAAYAAVVALNDNDEIKQGGCFPQVEWDKAKDRWNPNKWFSWMPYNYPETCKNLKEVMEELGFDTEEMANGDLLIVSYNSKMGDEREFLFAIAPYVTPGGYLDWVGEDDAHWRAKFNGKTMIEKNLILVEVD
jgi:hypothetical protein